MKMSTEKELLPWYVNHTLSTDENQSVESWLQRGGEIASQQINLNRQIADAITSQALEIPSSTIQTEIFAKLSPISRKASNATQWAFAVPITVLLMVLLWIIVQPGNNLNWSIPETAGTEMSAIRIYRAPMGSLKFQKIDEFPVLPDQKDFQYFDTYLVPLLSYHYIIEMVDQTGQTSISQATSADSQTLIVMQLAILLTSCLFSYGFIKVAQQLPSLPHVERSFS